MDGQVVRKHELPSSPMHILYVFDSGNMIYTKTGIYGEKHNLEVNLGKIEQDKSLGGDLTKTSRSVESLTILKTKQSKRLHFYLSRYSHKV